jgi:hypothetical protein
LSCKQDIPAEDVYRKCIECGGQEIYHDYDPPSWSSDDGLPTFIGCYCKGLTEVGRSDDEDFYTIPICDCTEFDPGDD